MGRRGRRARRGSAGKGGRAKRGRATRERATEGAGAKKGADARRGTGRRAGLFGSVRYLATLAAIVLFIRVFLMGNYVIDSGSMENTLLVGDFLAVNKLAIGPRIPFTNIRIPGYSEPGRGEVLVFDPHHEENMTIVKRVVGMPGDTLEMRDKVLYLNGEVHDEPYVETGGPRDYHEPGMRWQNGFLVGGARDDYLGTWDNWGPLVVPADHYFMLGDNRDDSLDSRLWGFLEGWRFKGRVAFIYFSYDRDSYRPFPWITEVRGSRIGDRVR